MIRYFYGEDTFAAREAVTELAQKEKAQLRFINAHQIDGHWNEQLRTRGGLFGKELLVIPDPSELSKAVQEMIVKAADEGSSALVVLWDQEETNESSPVFARFHKEAQVFSGLSVHELTRWLITEAMQRGVTLPSPAAQRLVQQLGPDRYRLLSELERLSLMQAEITVDQIMAEVPAESTEGEVFELLRALTAKKREVALAQFQALLENGANELYIVSMLAYQFRTLYVLSRGKHTGVSPRAAAALAPVAKRRPPSAWLQELTRVAATDFAIKQGTVEARTGVTMLLLSFLL